jgi:hypothetical protein
MSEPFLKINFSTAFEFLRDGNNIAWRQTWEKKYIHALKTEYGWIIVKYDSIDATKTIYNPDFEDLFADDWNVQLHESNSEDIIFENLTAKAHETHIIEYSLDGSQEQIKLALPEESEDNIADNSERLAINDAAVMEELVSKTDDETEELEELEEDTVPNPVLETDDKKATSDHSQEYTGPTKDDEEAIEPKICAGDCGLEEEHYDHEHYEENYSGFMTRMGEPIIEIKEDPMEDEEDGRL